MHGLQAGTPHSDTALQSSLPHAPHVPSSLPFDPYSIVLVLQWAVEISIVLLLLGTIAGSIVQIGQSASAAVSVSSTGGCWRGRQLRYSLMCRRDGGGAGPGWGGEGCR